MLLRLSLLIRTIAMAMKISQSSEFNEIVINVANKALLYHKKREGCTLNKS